MFARLKKVLTVVTMTTVLGLLLSGCSLLSGDDPAENDPLAKRKLFHEHELEIRKGEACIDKDDQGKPRIVNLDDDDEFVAVGNRWLPYNQFPFDVDCLTQAQLDEQEMHRTMTELVEADKACYVSGREMVEYDDEFVAQDRNGICLTQSEVDTDNRLTASIVSDLETIEADDWKQRASAVVDLYCSIDRMPVEKSNRAKVQALLTEAYEADRTYSGKDYPYTFEEAKQWCNPSKDVPSPTKHSSAPPPVDDPEPPALAPEMELKPDDLLVPDLNG